MASSREARRLDRNDPKRHEWREWGPYVSDRHWGTVREDYSESGDAWNYFTFDDARWRAYRSGEDAIGGFCDLLQRLCLGVALWNGNDPFLKERLFGLTNAQGNHGEDVKELYYYLDAVPSHAYQRMLYKYPQTAFPYADLVETNARRTRLEPEYELLDTGVFDENRYFDVTIEYAKAEPHEICMRVTAVNRGPDPAVLHLLPTAWFRHTWSEADVDKPLFVARDEGLVEGTHPTLGALRLEFDAGSTLLFCDNETNASRVPGADEVTAHPKDAIGDYVVEGRHEAVNPRLEGTKVAGWSEHLVQPGEAATAWLRLHAAGPAPSETAEAADVDGLIALRAAEADAFFDELIPASMDDDPRNVLRQALAGVLWTKQFYEYDVDAWLRAHGTHPMRVQTGSVTRNQSWFHMRNANVISMPDKWEYPWFAAWDLAFHTLALDLVDPEFSKGQVDLMLSEPYLHPNGQIPAYEWNFSDVNPPVHAWATLFAYTSSIDEDGNGDIEFLREAFKKLLLNFTWWVNRKDRDGRNVYEGGFLGLDNIGVFDRSAALPTGGHLEQADGTAWMAIYSQNMLELALELSAHDPSYEDLVLKFVQHFFWIAAAMDPPGDADDELWDQEDGFYYDVLCLPDGTAQRVKVRSMVGLLPLCAATVIPEEALVRFPNITARVGAYLERNRDLFENIADPTVPGVEGRRLLAAVNEEKLRRILARMLDEERFFSPYGIRSLSRWHKDHPYVLELGGQHLEVHYLPGESDSGLFGGNSNWRGPVWFPTNLLLIRALFQYYLYYGDAFTIECPTGSGQQMTLFEVAKELSRRLCSIFLRGPDGGRPVFGSIERYRSDPNFRDLILFHEYFNGDTGEGVGASHQTGWTGAVARILQLFEVADADSVLHGSTRPMMRRPHA